MKCENSMTFFAFWKTIKKLKSKSRLFEIIKIINLLFVMLQEKIISILTLVKTPENLSTYLTFYILNSLESNLNRMGWNFTLLYWQNIAIQFEWEHCLWKSDISITFLVIHWPFFEWTIITSEKVNLSNSTVFEINFIFIQ